MQATTEQRPQIRCHEEFLQTLGLPYRVMERSGTVVLAELVEQEVPAEWFDAALLS